jgi:DNA-binding Lrp family transcriptional regulator
MRLLSNEAPRSIKEIANELRLSEESTYNAVYLLYKRGALFRSEKPGNANTATANAGWLSPQSRH